MQWKGSHHCETPTVQSLSRRYHTAAIQHSQLWPSLARVSAQAGVRRKGLILTISRWVVGVAIRCRIPFSDGPNTTLREFGDELYV